MAKLSVAGLDEVQEGLQRLDSKMRRGAVARIMKAGSEEVKKDWVQLILDRHNRTGGMMGAVAPTQLYEDLGGAVQYVYPQGYNPNGERYAAIAYYINNKRPGDKFITKSEKKMEQQAQAAMSEEMDKILQESGLV